MPKVNYGFKGDTALTLSQAIAAGAVVSSQDYGYVVQLGGVTPLSPPGAPTGLTATPGNAQVALSWTAPSSAGSSAVTGYQIVYVADNGSEVTVSAAGTSATITGLTNGTTYNFSVSAINDSAGAGTPASVSGTPVASNPFTGFARRVDTNGNRPWPGTWSNTSNSFTITNNPQAGNDHLFTLSGNSGSITVTAPASSYNTNYYAARIRSAAQHGGGTLDKSGYYEYGSSPTYLPSSLNAGSYWITTPNSRDGNYPSDHTVTVQFANSVLTSAKPRPNVTDFVQFTPAAQVSASGLVTSFTVYANANSGKVFFTVPAGSARSVTIAFTATLGANTGWDLSNGGVNALHSVVNYNNSGWSLDKSGLYSAPYPYGMTKTLTMNPGDYSVDLRRADGGSLGGYTGTITIT